MNNATNAQEIDRIANKIERMNHLMSILQFSVNEVDGKYSLAGEVSSVMDLLMEQGAECLQAVHKLKN